MDPVSPSYPQQPYPSPPEDLAGKTVGVASLSSARLPEAKAMAEEAGVGDDVEFVAVGVGAQEERAHLS